MINLELWLYFFLLPETYFRVVLCPKWKFEFSTIKTPLNTSLHLWQNQSHFFMLKWVLLILSLYDDSVTTLVAFSFSLRALLWSACVLNWKLHFSFKKTLFATNFYVEWYQSNFDIFYIIMPKFVFYYLFCAYAMNAHLSWYLFHFHRK